nr:hypothetical protein [Tanacetum cinerariifolium]
MDLENDNEKVNMPLFPSPEPMPQNRINDLCTNLVDFTNMALAPHDQRHIWLCYQVEGYNKEIVHDFEQRLETIFGRQVNRVHILDFKGLTPDIRLFEIRAPLVHEFLVECFSTCRIGDEMGLDVAEDGFRAYWLGSERLIPDYWVEISSGRDFLRGAPSYTYIRDPVWRLCHRLISYSISRRGRHLKRRLAHHFGLASDDGLRGLSVVTRKIPLIDMGELVKLNIYREIGDDWAWVALGPERQQVFDGTFWGSSLAIFERHTRQRTRDASTSIAPQQPDP